MTIWFIVPSTGRPELTPEQLQIADGKWKRYTLGKWLPSSKTFLYRLGLLDYVGSTLLLGRTYTVTLYSRTRRLTVSHSCYVPVTGYPMGWR